MAVTIDRTRLCPVCGRQMVKVLVSTERRDYDLWTCVPCIKEADKKRKVTKESPTVPQK